MTDLAALPIVAHPLKVWLVERDIPLDQAARAFGVTTRAVNDWIARRSQPVWWRAGQIARALGRDSKELFPPVAKPDAGE